MQLLTTLISIFLMYSCATKEYNSHHIVVQNNYVNIPEINKMDVPAKILLSWYLFAYGNECYSSSNSVKCKILKELNIPDECHLSNIKKLNKWLSNDKLIQFKLKKNCPLLPTKGAIQNKIIDIVINRKMDTFNITFKANGLNNIQEKTWNIEQSDFYVLKGKSLVKI